MLPIEIMGYVEYHFDPTIAALATIMMVATLGVMLLIAKDARLAERGVKPGHFSKNKTKPGVAGLNWPCSSGHIFVYAKNPRPAL